MERIILFEHKDDEIQISMKLYFNLDDQLIFDGYDIGKKVSDFFGDSDYEYTYTIEPWEVNKIYKVLGIEIDDRRALLRELKKRFGKNTAFSEFGAFMEANNIKYTPFTYT